MAAEGALVGASAALGCGTMGMAVYSNISTYLAQRAQRRHNHEGTPDCAAQIIATVGGISRQVLGSPALVRSAFTDPMEELRKARERSEKFATAEISVAGEALSSGYAAFNGEVIRTGPSFDTALPVVALGGAQVSRDGKTLTVQPKQTPSLLMQLPDEKEAEKWQTWLQEATDREDPIQRLHDVLTEAHDLEKHLTDMHNQMKRELAKKAGPHGALSPSAAPSPVAGPAAPVAPNVSAELLEEMKQQLLLKESLESALRQKVEYMDLQLRQKEQENQYLKVQMDATREEMKTVREQQASPTAGPELVQELKRTEEALSLERANAVTQAKALAEAHVQLKRLQERPTNESMLRAHQEELMQLRGELRRMEEERNSARLGLANQAMQLSALSDQQAELQHALNAAHAEIKRQKEQLEAEPSLTRRSGDGATPRGDSSKSLTATSKLSHSELQVLRTHMQSAVRRALEGAGAEQGDYQQKLQELDEKLVELSPTRLKMRSGSGAVIREVEQKLSQLTPREVSPRIQANGASGSNAFGMEETIVSPEVQAPLRLSPLRRPSNMSSEAFPQGISSAGDMYVRPATASLSATHSGSMTLPQPTTEIRPSSSGSGRLAAPSSWQAPSSLQAPPVMPRSVEVLPAAQMAANAMAATNAWRPNWLNPKAFQTLPREPFPRG